jgi:hypothetical protein
MLDDLQDFDDSADFLDELDDLDIDEIEEPLEPYNVPGEGRLFGMNPFQRFILSFEFFFLACILSSLCLLVFNKIAPSF